MYIPNHLNFYFWLECEGCVRINPPPGFVTGGGGCQAILSLLSPPGSGSEWCHQHIGDIGQVRSHPDVGDPGPEDLKHGQNMF